MFPKPTESEQQNIDDIMEDHHRTTKKGIRFSEQATVTSKKIDRAISKTRKRIKEFD